jgi:hypothetical protein
MDVATSPTSSYESPPARRLHSRAGRDVSAPRRVSVRAGVLVMAVYLVASVFAYLHSWAHPATVAIGGGAGDQAQTMWYLRWVPWALQHGHDPFFTVWANYPIGVNLVSQTSVMALGFVLAPITLLWGPVATWNVAITLALALSGGAGYLLCRRFTAWRPAAFAGGLLIGFGPYMVGQGYGHLNLVFVPLPPLMFLALYELIVDQKGAAWRWGAFLGAMVVVQFFISTEILATTAMFAIIALVVIVIACAFAWRSALRTHFRHAIVGLAVCAVGSLIILAIPIYELLRGPQHIQASIIGFRYYYSVLAAPILPTSNVVFGTGYQKVLGGRIGGGAVENGTYLGVPLILFALVASFVVRRAVLRVAAVMALVVFIFSLGTKFHYGPVGWHGFWSHLALPSTQVNNIPLLNQAFPVRYSLYVALFVAVVLAVGLDALHEGLLARLVGGGVGSARRAVGAHTRATSVGSHAGSSGASSGAWVRRTAATALPALVGIVALLPLLPAWPYRGQGNIDVPRYFTSSAVKSIPFGSVALVYPYPNGFESDPQLWQAEADDRFQLIGGYFLVPAGGGFTNALTSTPTFTGNVLSDLLNGPAPKRTAALRTQLRSELGSWHTQSVLVEPVGHEPVSFFTWLIGRPANSDVGQMYEWYDVTW